jgi:hypothetical protein
MRFRQAPVFGVVAVASLTQNTWTDTRGAGEM